MGICGARSHRIESRSSSFSRHQRAPSVTSYLPPDAVLSIHAHVLAPSIAVFNGMSLLARPADSMRYGAGTKSTG